MISNEPPIQQPAPSPDQPKTAATPTKKGQGWIWLLVVCVFGGATYFVYQRSIPAAAKDGQQGTQTAGAGGRKGGKQGDGRPIPVVAATAKRGDMNIYLNGLGSVTAFNTVTARTRVDGQLIKVSFTEGQLVKEGEPLAQIDPRPYQVQLEQAQGQMTRDQAQLKNAKLDQERYQVLLQQDSVPKQQLDTQKALVNQFEGVIQSDQGAIDAAQLQLTYCTITAPITGRIGLRLVDQGNIVHSGDTNGLAVITQLQPIALLFNIPEDSLPQLQKKMQGGMKLPIDAYDRDFKVRLAAGSLLTTDNQIDQNTGTVRLKGMFANGDNALFPNQFVNARLLVDVKRNTVLVPNAAIQRSPSSAFVYIVKPDSTVEVRDIVVGPTEGDTTSIDQGVNPGEVAVIDGVDKLQPGVKVTTRQAGQAPGSASRGLSKGKGPGK